MRTWTFCRPSSAAEYHTAAEARSTGVGMAAKLAIKPPRKYSHVEARASRRRSAVSAGTRLPASLSATWDGGAVWVNQINQRWIGGVCGGLYGGVCGCVCVCVRVCARTRVVCVGERGWGADGRGSASSGRYEPIGASSF